MDKKERDIFKKRWLEISKELKTKCLEPNQCYNIKIGFLEEVTFIMGDDSLFELMKLSNDLDIALELAISNYNLNKLEHKRGWSISLFGNHIKSLPRLKR